MERISIPERITPASRIEEPGREDLAKEHRRRRVPKPSLDDESLEPEPTDTHDLNELA